MKLYKIFRAMTVVLLLGGYSIRHVQATGITPVPFTQVHITDQFWKQRLDIMRKTTIRYAFQKCENAGQLRNFEYAGMIVSGQKKVGELTFQSGQPYDDAEVYKVLEGASYLLKVQKDEELETYCDGVIKKICSAQEPDGYLQTNFTIHNPLHPWYEGEKWKMDWNLSHETFNVGELIEAGIAYYQATGKRQLLDCAIKAADNMLSVFNEQGIRMAPGHAVVEMALVRLYELTQEPRYLKGCKFFLDCRGIRQFNPQSNDQRVNGKYWQDHLPATQQRTAEGHAVRALYFYSGMADWILHSQDQAYEQAVTAIWNNIASRKFYITGGFGSRDNNEAFGEDYELPNSTAYCETCASVAGSMFNLRMFRLHGESKYIDMLERALYNTVLDGYGISGKHFYYPNRLECSSRGDMRSEWFGTSCCPTNLSRLIPAVPGYIYATTNQSLYVNLYVNSTAEARVGSSRVSISQQTHYPYDGNVVLSYQFLEDMQTDNGYICDIRVRIPGWAVNKPVESDLYTYVNPTTQPVVISVNGVEYTYQTQDGYAILPISLFSQGDVHIHFPMDVHQVISHEKLESNQGLRSYERGPIVYCTEGIDNDGNLDNIYIPDHVDTPTLSPALSGIFDGDLPQITLMGKKTEMAEGKPQEKDVPIQMIPYFARASRTPSQMKVWMPTTPNVMSSIQYLDELITCDPASERAHFFGGTNIRKGADLGWVDSNGGYMKFYLKVDPLRPTDLILKLWGSDHGNRKFDIYVGSTRFAYEEIENFLPGQYYHVRYQIPFELSQGKDKILIRLQSIDGSTVGGIFGIYSAVSEEVPDQTVTVDHMWTSQATSLTQHQYSSNGGSGIFRARTWLDGSGTMGQRWTMTVKPTKRNYLMIYYWGEEEDARHFDIYCDDTFVASETLQQNNRGRFFFRTYIIPEEGTSGKEKVTIRLSSPRGTKTGGVFYAYMMAAAEQETSIMSPFPSAVAFPDVRYNLAGLPVNSDYRGITVQQGRKVMKR